MQKDVSKGFPSWLERVEVPKKGGTVHHPLVSDTRVAALAGQPELHHARTCGRRARRDLFQPDICVFDLDPSEDEPDVLRAAALAVRDLLGELGLPSWVKTSGSKGFHIVGPARRRGGLRTRWRRFAHAVGRVLVRRDPEHLTQEFAKVDRGGRILVDTGRNGYSATFAAAYAVRARAGRARVRAVHLGGDRERRRRAADVHAADDGGPRRRRRRPLVGHAVARTVAARRERAVGRNAGLVVPLEILRSLPGTRRLPPVYLSCAGRPLLLRERSRRCGASRGHSLAAGRWPWS